MSNDDDIKEILATIKELKQDTKELKEDVRSIRDENLISHKGLVTMIEAVQATQQEHTERFNTIDRIHKAMSMTVDGERTHTLKTLVEDVNKIKAHIGL